MYENRIKHLEESHRVLDKRITEMERTGNYKDLEIEDLKKQRLHLKDEIVILKRKQQIQEEENDRTKIR